MGLQHGRQVADQRSLIAQAMTSRLQELRRLGACEPAQLQPALAALVEVDRPLMEFLRGLAEALMLDDGDLGSYTLSSYLKDICRVKQSDCDASGTEGCTTWAASAPLTREGEPLLVKNRDYADDHVPLQTLARVAPTSGYRYLAIGSAGSPDVFSSGINERGLAVVDTHVLSHDLGPGLPRFSLMRELLTHHASAESGLAYLRSVPHMGGGTLILADMAGHLAVCESGHQHCGYVERRRGFVVSTNHYVTPELAHQWIDGEPERLRGNSQARRQRVIEALSGARERIDGLWAESLMPNHGSPQDAICRHSDLWATAVPAGTIGRRTISSVIFLPAGFPDEPIRQPALLLAHGQPCQGRWTRWRVND